MQRISEEQKKQKEEEEEEEKGDLFGKTVDWLPIVNE